MNQYEVDIKINDGVVPIKAIYKGREYKIIDVDDELIINGFKVFVQNGRIKKITLNNKCRHPNCNPFNGEFCLPHTILGALWGKQITKRLVSLLTTYHLDDCYDFPRELFTLKDPMTI